MGNLWGGPIRVWRIKGFNVFCLVVFENMGLYG